jgi:hypothetical protein
MADNLSTPQHCPGYADFKNLKVVTCKCTEIIPGNRGTVRSIERIWLLMKRELGASAEVSVRLHAKRHISPSVPGLVTQS